MESHESMLEQFFVEVDTHCNTKWTLST